MGRTSFTNAACDEKVEEEDEDEDGNDDEDVESDEEDKEAAAEDAEEGATGMVLVFLGKRERDLDFAEVWPASPFLIFVIGACTCA